MPVFAISTAVQSTNYQCGSYLNALDMQHDKALYTFTLLYFIKFCKSTIETVGVCSCIIITSTEQQLAELQLDAAVTPNISEMTYNVSSGTLNHTLPTQAED